MNTNIIVVTYNASPVFAVPMADEKVADKYIRDRIAKEFPEVDLCTEERGWTTSYYPTPFKLHTSVRLCYDETWDHK